MSERHMRYLTYYDSKDKIMHLNFYSNFKLIYDKMSEDTITVGGGSFVQLINELEWNEDMIIYVKGIIPYPGRMDWIGTKRILTVINLKKFILMTLEILLHKSRMKVYDWYWWV